MRITQAFSRLLLWISLLAPFSGQGAYTLMQVEAKKLAPNNWPALMDDLAFEHLSLALERQMQAFERSPLDGQLVIGGDRYSLAQLKAGVIAFQALLKNYETCMAGIDLSPCQAQLEAAVKAQFHLYRAGKAQEPGELTAYYSPTLKGTRTASLAHPYGIYQLPVNERLRQFTHTDILFDNVLQGQGLELFFVQDAYELYLFQVEGGGRIEEQTPEGVKYHYLSYAGRNAHAFRFVSRYMVEQGLIPDTQIATQREFLRKNPHRLREVLSSSPSYVFFKLSDHEPAGQEDIPLTIGRSMAQDSGIFKRKGMIAFVRGRKPEKLADGKVEFRPFGRFFVDQDTGGAIKGIPRADLYMGYGEEAELAANYMHDQAGEILFFMLKQAR